MKYKVITMALLVSATCLGGAQLGSVQTTKVNNSGTSNKVVTTTKPVSNNENKGVNNTNVNANDTNKNTTNSANKNADSSKNENTNTNTTANKTTNNVDSSTKANDSTQFMAQVEQAIYKQVNEQRVKAGVAPLSYSDTMQKYARMKSEDMAKNNYFSHENKSGKLTVDIMKADGVQYSAWGENIAYISGVSDPTELANMFMKNWMNSPGHRANILSPNFTSIGVGVYKQGDKVYATQEFMKK